MSSFNFGMLEVAGGESGEAAVSVVVGKAKAEAAHASKAEAAAATGADTEKAARKNLYFDKLQHDNGIKSIEIEMKTLREVLINLRGEEKMLKEIGQDGCHVIQLSEEQRDLRLNQLSEEQQNFRQQQRKLRVEEAKFKQQQKEFYSESYAYNNGGRQGHPQVHNKTQVYVVKGTKQSSDAGTDADHKPEEEAATPANADAKPSSSVGAAASNNGYSGSKFEKKKVNLSGSQKKKKRNAAKKNSGNEVDKAKKQDSSEADVSRKTGKEPLADYKTLAEYEKIRQEKKKSSEDVSRAEQRKVSAEEFKGMQMLEKKKLDDEEAVLTAEKVQKKAKDAEDAKPKKSVKLPLKDLSFESPKRVVIYEDGSSNRGRFNGGYQSHSRDNSTDSWVPAAGRGGDNGRAAQNVAGNYGNGSPRDGYSGGRGNGPPRGDYSGGRGDGGYGAPRGDYSRGRGYGAPRGEGYSGRGNGGYNNQGGNYGGYQRRQGNDNYYRPRGRGYSGNGHPPAPKPEEFPTLVSAPARAAAQVAAPTAPVQS